jgi:nucleoid-associated protein YgaU
MSRSLRLVLAATLSLAGYNLVYSQDAQPASASSGVSVANLKAENAKLKKEVSDAAKTIADLQTKLTQTSAQLDAATQAVAAANSAAAAAKVQPAPAAAPAVADTSAADATPTGPHKALPLDATNVVTTPGAPGATPDAGGGPSKSYTVVKGDSLWKIAHKMYPHDTANGEDKIRDANKDVFNGKFLQPGQVLVIPQ